MLFCKDLLYQNLRKRLNVALLPKEGQDLISAKNYIPISLLNNDHKIFITILADGWKKILEDFICLFIGHWESFWSHDVYV